MAKEKRNATIAWLERSNPLRGLTISQANMIFDCARNGDTQRLHWMYQEIETQNPVLSMATTRRAGAAANFAWRVAERAAMDGSLSAEQKDAAERFFGDIENLSDLFEHLDLALFRGFAHAQPIWEDERTVRHIELIDSWKFLKKDGEWLFNPVCDGFSSNCVSCRDARLVTVERRRPVDVPALAIHLRAAVGSRDWGRFIERYALPKPAVVMAANATEKDRDSYLESASALENGQVTVWPSGASLMDFAGSSRGVDPFTAFIQHQEKTILMLATGGTLGSMAESGAGTLAGNAQADVWDQIVSRDAGILAQAVARSLLRPFLAAAFPGQPVAVDFDFDLTKKPTPKEVFETATAAKSAGYLVAQDVLEEETGWKLEKAPETPPPAPGFAMNSRKEGETPFKNDENGFKNAPRVSDGQGDPSTKDALVEALSGLFEKSLAEAAAGEIKNTVDANGQEHDKLGRFGEEGGGAAAKDSPNKPAADKADASGDSGSSEAPAEAATAIEVGSINTDSPEEQERQIAKASAAFEACLAKHVDVPAAFHRSDLGDIDLRWGKSGNHGKGLAHFIERRDALAKARPGQMDGRAVLAKMPETIIKGKVTQVTHSGGHPNIVIEHSGYRAIITRDQEGGNHWFLSGYEISNEGRGYRAKRK